MIRKMAKNIIIEPKMKLYDIFS